MMNKVINIITSIFGLAFIPFSAWCFYTLEKVSGWDVVLLILGSGILLYIKNNNFSSMLNEVIKSKSFKR